MIAVVVIFQPEMQGTGKSRTEEHFGKSFNFDFNKVENGKFSDKTITELVKACYEMEK